MASKKVVQTVQVPAKHANRLAFTPDGRHVFLLDRDAGDVIVLNAAARKEVKRIRPDRPEPRDVTGNGDVLMAPDGSRAFVTVHINRSDAAQPDNQPVPGAREKHYIAIIDLKTLEVTGRIPTDLPGDELAWVDLK